MLLKESIYCLMIIIFDLYPPTQNGNLQVCHTKKLFMLLRFNELHSFHCAPEMTLK